MSSGQGFFELLLFFIILTISNYAYHYIETPCRNIFRSFWGMLEKRKNLVLKGDCSRKEHEEKQSLIEGKEKIFIFYKKKKKKFL